MKFSLGQLVATPAAIDFLSDSGVHLYDLVRRHLSGDWGDLDAHDAAMNDDALKSGEDRIFSSYKIGDEKVWVITEWDRSVTTVLMPSDY